MAIAINPDVRELDFSDNVKVSKFMQDFSDFRSKKWITYRPVNAPSEADPFMGGTRQFVINMGTGHILDTWYSGLWYTLKFANASKDAIWPFSTSLPRTSAAWIESVTFMHSKVASHIDERMTDYDAVSAIFVPAKDIKSMDQTFFHFDYSQCMDGNPFNEFSADDPYGKMLPCGVGTTERHSFGSVSFFIPLCRLSTIFNSGKYFFPSLLRGNGEMSLMIRSVANSLSEVFGGEGCGFSSFASTNCDDRIYRTLNEGLGWGVYMDDLKLITLNLDNAFLTKEYNAFIASGRKFIRSFKAYNYQFYQVKTGYNRIEIANTHQSISHIILAFQTDYSVRCNGRAVDALSDHMLGNQKTIAVSQSVLQASKAFTLPVPSQPQHPILTTVPTLIGKPKTGNTNTMLPPYEGHAIGNGESVSFIGSLGDSDPVEVPDNRTLLQKSVDFAKTVPARVGRATVKGAQTAANTYLAGGGIKGAATAGIAATIAEVVKAEPDPPPNASKIGNVRSKSATISRSSRTQAAKPPKVPNPKDKAARQQLAEGLAKYAQQNLLEVARTKEAIQSVQQAVQEAKRIRDGEWEPLIAAAFPEFDWKTLGEQEVKDRASFIAYVQRLMYADNTSALGKYNRYRKYYSSFDQITTLTSLQKEILSMMFGIKNKKLNKLIGTYLDQHKELINTETVALIRYSLETGKPIPSDQTEFRAFCQDAALAFNTEMEATCAVIEAKETLTTPTGTFTPNGELAMGDLDEVSEAGSLPSARPEEDTDVSHMGRSRPRKIDGEKLSRVIIANFLPGVPVRNGTPIFDSDQATYLHHIMISILKGVFECERLTWHTYNNLLLPCEAKQIYDLGFHAIEKLQVYRGTGNGETVFSEPVNENMFYHISREAMGDSAEDHPFFSRKGFDRDCAYVVISLNTFMRDAHHEFWDGFSTNRVADRLYVEFENINLAPGNLVSIPPWYYDLGYADNCVNLNCKVFTIYDNIYYIDRDNNLNVSDTLLPLQEGRGPSTD